MIANFNFKNNQEARYDVWVEDILYAVDVSRKYRRGRYVNVRLTKYGKSWIHRNYMFSAKPSGGFVWSDWNVRAFWIDDRGFVRAVEKDKEKLRHHSDGSKIEGDWEVFAEALRIRMGDY